MLHYWWDYFSAKGDKMLGTPLRTPYNYDMLLASEESALRCNDPTRADQSSAEEVDINTLVRRFGITGELPQNVRAPVFGDFTGLADYHQALNAIVDAKEAFEQLPADIRKRFNNDPGDFVAFCSDPANAAEMTKFGFVKDSADQIAATVAASGAPGAPAGPEVPPASSSSPATPSTG